MDEQGNLYKGELAKNKAQREALKSLTEEEYHSLQEVDRKDRHAKLKEWRKQERNRK